MGDAGWAQPPDKASLGWQAPNTAVFSPIRLFPHDAPTVIWRPHWGSWQRWAESQPLGDEFCYTVLMAALLGLQSLTKLLLSSFSLSDPGASPYLVLRTVFCSLFLKCFYQIILSGLSSSLPHLHSLDIAGHAELSLCKEHSLGQAGMLMLFPSARGLGPSGGIGLHITIHPLPPPAKRRLCTS